MAVFEGEEPSLKSCTPDALPGSCDVVELLHF